MVDYYIAGGSTFDDSEYGVYAYCDHGGYDESEYGNRPIQINGDPSDPYWSLGLDTETMASGQQQAEFGLLDSWRIKITASGIWGYHTASGWMDVLGGGGDVTPDHNLLNGLNDGEDYEHITQSQKDDLHSIYTLENHNSSFHTVSYESANANIQSHVASPVSDAHHTVVVAGDLNHNDLANIDAGNINHLSDDQVTSLHDVLTNLNQLATRNHNDLQNIQGGADLQHLTALQVGALHVASHTIVSHSDTTGTGAELNTLTGGGETALHSHAGGGVETIVTTEAQLQTAIDNIGASFGTIIMNADITLTGSLDVDNGGSVILKGQGDETVITTADADAFTITSCDSLVILDLKINCSAFTTAKNVFNVNETNDNPIYLGRVYITGTQGNGVLCTSNNIRVANCKFTGLTTGVNIYGNYNWVNDCHFDGGGTGVMITGGDINVIHGNNMDNCTAYGIRLEANSTWNRISLNRIYSVPRGIYLYGASFNTLIGNDITYSTYYAIVGYHPSTPNSDNNIIAYNNCSYTQSDDTANDRGGIILAANCDDWLIIGNFCSYNTNAGSGSGHGIRIGISSANENSVIGNHLRLGNNVAYADAGASTYTSGNHI